MNNSLILFAQSMNNIGGAISLNFSEENSNFQIRN